MKVAVLGASGFIGARAVELMHLERFCQLRPIVRSYSSMATLSRFGLDIRVTDVMDRQKLAQAVEGCDAVVHSIVGDPAVIIDSAKACYEACVQAGIKRLVYLSSIAVHGLAPAEGTNEDSSITDDQSFPYNNAKVQSERLLLELSQNQPTELVILRPGIVYGPRSTRWSAGLADELLAGQACLIDGGLAICNAVYVDNVVTAIMKALTASSDTVNRQAFFVSDEETITWRDMYEQLAAALGLDAQTIACPARSQVKLIAPDLVRTIQSKPGVQRMLPFLPARLKSTVKAALRAWTGIVDQVAGGGDSDRRVTAEMAALQSCAVKLPNSKAQRLLGYEPGVSFAEGSRRTAEWLRFAGYPVVRT